MAEERDSGVFRGTEGHMAEIVERNIQALLKRRKTEEHNRTVSERISDGVTKFTGSMLFVGLHLLLFGIWVVWNLGWLGLPPFDESFVVLAMFASVEAIFLSTFVLISQNRMNIQADKRADLDLQVSLLAEHEITRLVTLVTAIAKKLDIAEAHDPEIDELARDVQPEKVMDTMEHQQARMEKDKR
ncbi:DUF1003 domain-containing protein [Rufibacter glacialis]|uniref:DUF1003 domain-containing protein n=1 Tax=Rufibacter glacialis TaxID=1259555 RepID=A0A5M8QJL5_9BACT|nr:DUF1003 domain-containing protein [Rufibacter glacialis]KAA6434522.1 DUF1003 domain-containing protein [Rufibacter glacialis]GGK70332.1 hypothetical protein GCM10011405_18020 [Rufibacter glacialis]